MQIAQRELSFGPYHLASTEPTAGEAPYMIAGSRLYVLGSGSGRPAPIGVEHLIGMMGGIWAHPVRVGDAPTIELLDERGAAPPTGPARLRESLGAVSWRWSAGDLVVERLDFVLPDQPALVLRVSVRNPGPTGAAGLLRIGLRLSFTGAWMGGLESGEASYQQHEQLLLGQDGRQAGWGLAFGTAVAPAGHQVAHDEAGTRATLDYQVGLEPGAAQTWDFLLTVEHQEGAAGAARSWRQLAAGLAGAAPARLAELPGVPRLHSADEALTRDVALAQANLQLLSANYPDLGAYFLAGLPEYPQLFGCDTSYSVPGAVAGGFGPTAGAALLTLAGYAERACGRVPHEVTTNGRIFNPGNVQETPQLTIAVWDYLRWSGDAELARRLFPICREGLVELIPTLCGPSGPYPYGDGMVERMGMGSRKLDSACYTIAGLRALADLAEALGMADAASYRTSADQIQAAFERDWWLEAEGLYADSMHSDGSLQLDRHWTAVLPVQLGLAAPERAARVMARLEAEFVNQWGLVHTVGADERVWTLPTGLLALAAFASGRPERGLQLARSIALTTRHGTLGSFKELIPEGLCFVQLWSAALYLQIIFEGLLGLRPDAPAHRLEIAPGLPAGSPPITLRDLRVGDHRLSLSIAPQALELEHLHGTQPLAVRYAGATWSVAPGERLSHTAKEVM